MSAFRIVLSTVIGAVIIGISYLGFTLNTEYKAFQELKEDYAYVTKIDFGLFNIKEWREKALAVFTEQIQNFTISPSAYTEVQKELELYLYRVYADYIANGYILDQIFKDAEQNKKINPVLLNMIKAGIGPQIQQLNIPKYIPGMAAQLSQELKKNEPRIKEVMQGELRRMMINEDRYPTIDPREKIYTKYNQTDLTSTKTHLKSLIDSQNSQTNNKIKWIYIGLIGITLLTLMAYKVLGFNLAVTFISLISIVFLALGISLPMIDIDARMNSFVFSLFGQDLAFEEQSILYQSKSILQVTKTLIEGRGIDLKIVGIMVLLFSIVFPLIKLALSALFLYSKRLQSNAIVRGLIFHLGKWSMADVFVVALFMAYIGFFGLIEAQLGMIERNRGGFGIETVNYTSLSPGALFFATYCVLSIVVGIIISRSHFRKETLVEN